MRSFTFRWLGIATVVLVAAVGFVPSWQRVLARRNLIADQYHYGDLYNKTNIAQFKQYDYTTSDNLDSTDLPATKAQGVHLYTVGDSFTNIDTVFYAAEKNTHHWVGHEAKTIQLDPTKRNVLVIEIVERVLQERFRDHSWLLYAKQAYTNTHHRNTLPKPESWLKTILNTRFGTDLNSRLEFILFNNDVALAAKELKASLLMNWFDRAAGARLSNNQRYLFYDIETDTTQTASSFRHLSNTDIDQVVAHLNRVTQYYRQMGFEEVYLTIVPNKVTVQEPTLGTYNHQIERIEQHPALQPTVVSLFGTVRQHPDWYHLGDGHWNQQGRRYWMNKVNGLVRARPRPLAMR
jgi:hypothetical protein